MTKCIPRAALVALAFLVFYPSILAQRAAATAVPLRSGTVITKTDVGGFTSIKAVDAAGKPFWVLTTLCVVGEQGKIEVLAGEHYDKVFSDHLEASLEDVYTAQLLRIGDVEVAGFGTPGLPAGCVVLK